MITISAIYSAVVAVLAWYLSIAFPRWSRLRVSLTASLPVPLLLAFVGGLRYLHLVLFPWKDKGPDHYAMAFIGPAIALWFTGLFLTFGYIAAFLAALAARSRSSSG